MSRKYIYSGCERLAKVQRNKQPQAIRTAQLCQMPQPYPETKVQKTQTLASLGMMLCNKQQVLHVSAIIRVCTILCLYCTFLSRAYHIKVAIFNTGGFWDYVRLEEDDSNVILDFGRDISSHNESVSWRIHELPVDLSIDPKDRCMEKFVGPMKYSGTFGDIIGNVTVSSLEMRSIVVLINDSVVTCATIWYEYNLDISATVKFRSGVFGWMQLLEETYGYYDDYEDTYVVGAIQAEKEGQCSNKTFSIVVHNNTLGPFETVDMATAGECSDLDEGTPILHINVYCPQLSARFSHQLSNPLITSLDNGIAVSVKNSGTIISCGRLESHFPVLASYHNQIILQQKSPYHGTSLASWRVWETWKIIHQYTILEGINGTCSSNADIFNPWNPPPEKIGKYNTTDQYPVGDVPNRYYRDLPLIGSATILGHVVNDSGCNSLELAVPEDCGDIIQRTDWRFGVGHTVKGCAKFPGPIVNGKITFTQGVYLPEWVLGPSIVTVDLSYADSMQATNDAKWHIIREELFNGSCTSSSRAPLYNPYQVQLNSSAGYMNECNPRSQQRCAMGDLSGKLGTLAIEASSNPHKTYSFYDENLFLTGNYTIFGHSVVVYGPTDEIISCARIEPWPLLVQELNISFPSEGVKINRVEVGDSIASSADVPIGDVLVNYIKATKLNETDCLNVSLWITGINEENKTSNVDKVQRLNNQKNGTYAAGPCVYVSPTESSADPSNNDFLIPLYILVVVLILSIVVCGVLLILVCRRKQRIYIYAVEGQGEVRQFSPALIRFLPSKGDHWEMVSSHFEIGAKLGEGNYGQVYKGTLSADIAMTPAKIYIARQTLNGKPPYTVAIKLLKGGVDGRDVQNFLEEIAMMKKVSSGECCQVVKMVGCVSTALPLALALEFVPFGDLLSYLKYWRQKSNAEAMPTLSEDSPLDYDKLHPQGGEEVGLEPAVERRGAPGASTGEVFEMTDVLGQKSKDDISGPRKNDEQPLSYAMLYSATTEFQEGSYSPLGEPDLEDLPSFAYQISQGMEYLSSLGVLHRDLACRNILVDEGKLLKISDFGLSRDTPEYVSSLQDKMPLRWMAPETVTDNIFTDKSDVWSFGVCLWEMYTLGATPYEDLPMATLLAQIISGYRLPMPELSSDKIYQLMLICWSEEPQARLNFTQLKYFFKSMIYAGSKGANYINIEP